MDNTTLNQTAGGDTIRTIDRSLDVPPGTSKTQVVAIDVGGEASEQLVVGAVPTTSADIVDILNSILLTLQAINLQLANIAGGNSYVDADDVSTDT